MQLPAVSLRFGLILEAYLRARQEHIPILAKQLEMLEKFKKGTEVVCTKGRDKEKAKAALREFLSEPDTMKVMNDLRSPLDPSFRCSNVK